jgi:hypothetical protein
MNAILNFSGINIPIAKINWFTSTNYDNFTHITIRLDNKDEHVEQIEKDHYGHKVEAERRMHEITLIIEDYYTKLKTL